MTARRPLIAGNWKMNMLQADGLGLAQTIASKAKAAPDLAADLLICPPFTLIAPIAAAVAGTPVAVGGQDCHHANKGAHTGDIAAPMLTDLGARYVILGHSERRTDHGESNAIVKAKAEAALRAGLIVILCVGESLAEREAGQTMEVVRAQLENSLPDEASSRSIVIAYEPVWAIGTGKVATPAQAQEVHAHIRAVLAKRLGADQAQTMRILYGGSMKPDNARELLALPDVDGGLIGGASLNAEDFWAIARAV